MIKNEVIYFNELNNVTRNGYLIVDIEPDETEQQVFWLYIARFNNQGIEQTHLNIANINCGASAKKKLTMLEILDLPHSQLQTPVDQHGKLLLNYLSSDFLITQMPIFYFGSGRDEHILNNLIGGYNIENNFIDLQLSYDKMIGNDMPSGLEKVARSVGYEEMQHKVHNPIQDVEMTNYIIKKYNILFGK